MSAPLYNSVRPDPPLRADGRCRVCRRKRRHAVRNKYSGDQAVTDPFCSTVCCRRWHGCETGKTISAKMAA